MTDAEVVEALCAPEFSVCLAGVDPKQEQVNLSVIGVGVSCLGGLQYRTQYRSCYLNTAEPWYIRASVILILGLFAGRVVYRGSDRVRVTRDT